MNTKILCASLLALTTLFTMSSGGPKATTGRESLTVKQLLREAAKKGGSLNGPITHGGRKGEEMWKKKLNKRKGRDAVVTPATPNSASP
jgi:hypothetical protein